MEHIEHPDITAMERDGCLPEYRTADFIRRVSIFGGLVYKNNGDEDEED